MTCPSCGAEDQGGNFCSHCGAALPRACPSCGHPPLPNGRYCTRCGEELIGRQRPRWPYYLAAAAAVVLVLMLFLPRQTERAGPPRMTSPASGPAPGAGDAAGAVRLSGDMRENADRLFNRIMAAAERGDRDEVARFTPMAVQAYEMVPELDEDGLYHLAVLHLTAGNPGQALAAAERILARSPDHVLALGIGARAAAEAGDDDRARSLYRRLLEAYPSEAARPRPEYSDHRRMLAEYRQAARAYLGDAG